jgi:hypothetical protein
LDGSTYKIIHKTPNFFRNVAQTLHYAVANFELATCTRWLAICS